MNYLITGVAGFIAARTAELLVGQGHNVVGIDNVNDYYDVRLKVFHLQEVARAAGAGDALLAQLDYSGGDAAAYTGPDAFTAGSFTFHKTDVEDLDALRALFATHQFDAVINLAARAGVRYSIENPFIYMSTNVVGTLNLLECMKTVGVRKLVLASTSSLYAGQPMPFVETLPVNAPISPYAASKKAAEAMSYTYHHLYGIDVSVVRYFTVYGPACRPDMSILRFIKWIDEGTPITLFGDGTQSRDFTHVDDIAHGTIAAIQDVGYEVLNLGGGNEPVTINEMIAAFESHLGKKAVIDHKPFNNADMRDTAADITKARTLLGWEPRISPAQGFKETVEWYVRNRSWASQIQL